MIGEDRFTAEQLIGRRMSLDEAMDEAMRIRTTVPPSESATRPVRLTAISENPDGLSAREVEVLKLMAAGATSKEIAAQLVISVHTVESHITHVYQKIGGRGRADAAAYAHRHGLA
ncbi:MAG: helix-turn-helix transcriptional regulator [Chloroflexota bacterium]